MVESASGNNFVDYYQLLSIKTDAEPAQIRDAFIRLAKTHHPDVGGSTEEMQEFTKAYRTLMSATSRRSYDLLHDFHTGSQKAQYREYGRVIGTSKQDLSDDEIDDFIDQIFREYQAEASSKPKKSLIKRLTDYL